MAKEAALHLWTDAGVQVLPSEENTAGSAAETASETSLQRSPDSLSSNIVPLTSVACVPIMVLQPVQVTETAASPLASDLGSTEADHAEANTDDAGTDALPGMQPSSGVVPLTTAASMPDVGSEPAGLTKTTALPLAADLGSSEAEVDAQLPQPEASAGALPLPAADAFIKSNASESGLHWVAHYTQLHDLLCPCCKRAVLC